VTVRDKILATLEKGNAADRGFRETVYRQVFAAFEKSVKANTELSADDVFRRREQLVAIVEDIEKEFAEREQQAAWDLVPGETRRQTAGHPGAFAEAASAGYAAPEFVPSISLDERVSAGRGERVPAEEGLEPRSAEAEALLKEGKRQKRRKRKRASIWVRLTGWIVFLALLGAGGWWLWGEVQKAIETRGASIEALLDDTVDFEDRPLLPTRDDSEWIQVFSPADTEAVQGGAVAGRDEHGRFVSIGSAGRNPVVFRVPAERLQAFAGRSVIFSIRTRAQEDTTQMAVLCDFGAMGRCNRLRFSVEPTIAEYLFKVELANAQASGGTISIIPDIEGKGRMLDVYSIMMTAEE
jgi:hypothetical protein